MQLTNRHTGSMPGAGTVSESGRRTIVSESRVHVSEAEDAPATGGEVGEADVFGEVDEPEEPHEADETDESGGSADVTSEADADAEGAAGDAGPAEDAADSADAEGSAEDSDAEDSTDAEDDSDAEDAVDAEAADGAGDGAADLDPVARFSAELRQLPGEWYVVHSYAGYENRVKANLESRIQSLNMEDYIFQIEVPVHQVDRKSVV